ncbi:MAG: M16 family metallopeptidase, partial [Pyrinomonadaceae bacterium]
MKSKINQTRFENGPVVLTDYMPGVRSVTVGFFYRFGSRNEPNELNGITHFIEHCVFKGTAKRTAMDIAIEQDRLGGALDAFTTYEETGFVIKVIDEQTERAFDLVSDMLTNPRFDETDLENEQRVIIEEMKMNEDSPEEVLSDIFHREFFPAHPLGMSITGTPETVRSFGHESTHKFHERAFSPENLIVAAAGNIEHDLLLELVERGHSCPQHSNADRNVRVPVPAAPVVVQHRPDLEQAHLIVAVPFVGARDERRYAADLLESILGGGTSSRLWQKVREERGLAYNIGASTVMFRDCGYFAVSVATSPTQVEEVVDITVAEIARVVREGVSDEELSLMKDQSRAAILLDLEDSASRAGSLAQC